MSGQRNAPHLDSNISLSFQRLLAHDSYAGAPRSFGVLLGVHTVGGDELLLDYCCRLRRSFRRAEGHSERYGSKRRRLKIEQDFMRCLDCGQLLSQVGNFSVCPVHGTQSTAERTHDSFLSAETAPLVALASDLPFPLALVVCEYLKETNPFIKLHRLIDAADLLTRFTAIIMLSDLLRQCSSFPSPLRLALLEDIERPTFGVWKNLLRLACDNLPKQEGKCICFVPECPVFINESLLPLLGSNEGDAERKIIPLRNLLAHQGRLSDTKAQRFLSLHQQPFESLLTGLAFLSDFDLLACEADGRVVSLRGIPKMEGSFPAAEPPAELRHLLQPERVVLVRGSEGLDMFPLQAFGVVLQWRDEGTERAAEVAPQLYSRLNKSKGHLEYTSLNSRTVFSQKAGIALQRFREVFRLEEWRRLVSGKEQLRENAFDELIGELGGKEFVGRNDQVALVKERIKSLGRGVLWLSGKPGVGKSALMARLARDYRGGTQHYLTIPYFFRAGHAGCSVDQFLHTALSLLSEVSDVPVTLAPNPVERRVQFGAAVEQASAASNKKILFLIDGLDEIQPLESTFVSLILSAQASNVIWLCAGRPESAIEEPLRQGGATWLFAEGLPKMNEQAIRVMLTAQLARLKYALFKRDRLVDGEYENRFVEELVRKSEGLPLYVCMVIEDLCTGKWSLMDEDKLPNGLSAYFERILERLRISDIGSVLTQLFCLLAWAKEPITERTLKLLLAKHHLSKEPDWEELFRETLEHGHLMLHRALTPDGTPGWTFYHDTFRLHLLASDIVRRERNSAQSTWLEYCSQWKTLDEQALRRYALRNYAIHLFEAENYTDLYSLIDGGFLFNKYREFGSYYFVIDDVLRAKTAAIEHNDTPNLLKCCLAQALIASLAADEYSASNLVLASIGDEYDHVLNRTKASSDQRQQFYNLLLITEACLLADQVTRGLNALDAALNIDLEIRAYVPVISKIIRLIARVDIQRAISLAEKAAGGAEIVLLVQAAEFLLQEDRAAAKQLLEHAVGLVEKIQGSAMAPKEILQNHFLNYIAIRLAKVDLAGTQDIKTRLADNDWDFLFEEEGGLSAELRELAKTDFDAAIEKANGYSEPTRSQLLCSIAAEIADINAAQAHRLFLTVKNAQDEKTLNAINLAMVRITSAIGRISLQEGLSLAAALPDERARRRALAHIVVEHYPANQAAMTPYITDLLSPIDPEVIVIIAAICPNESLACMNHYLSLWERKEHATAFTTGYVYPDLWLAYPLCTWIGDWAMAVVDALATGDRQRPPDAGLLNELFGHIDDEFTELHLTSQLARAFGVEYARTLRLSASHSSEDQRRLFLRDVDALFMCVGIERGLTQLGSDEDLEIACKGADQPLYLTGVFQALAAAFIDRDKDMSRRFSRLVLELIPNINNQAKRIQAVLKVARVLRKLDEKKAWVALAQASHIFETEIKGDVEYISGFMATPPLQGIVRELSAMRSTEPWNEMLWDYLLFCDSRAESLAMVGNELRDLEPQRAREFLERAAQLAADKEKHARELDEEFAAFERIEAQVANAIVEGNAASFLRATQKYFRQEEPWQTRYLCKAAGWLAAIDVDEGLRLAGKIKGGGYKALALSEVVKVTASRDIARAMQIAFSLPNLWVNANWHDLNNYPLNPRYEAFTALSDAMHVRGDPEKALRVLAASASETYTLQIVIENVLRQIIDDDQAFMHSHDIVRAIRKVAFWGADKINSKAGLLTRKTFEVLNKEIDRSEEAEWWSNYEKSSLAVLFSRLHIDIPTSKRA